MLPWFGDTILILILFLLNREVSLGRLMFPCFSSFVLRGYINFELYFYFVHIALFCFPAAWPQECKQETQLMLTNLRDAFRGQSRSP